MIVFPVLGIEVRRRAPFGREGDELAVVRRRARQRTLRTCECGKLLERWVDVRVVVLLSEGQRMFWNEKSLLFETAHKIVCARTKRGICNPPPFLSFIVYPE
jgi:hypothetical protein